MFRSWIKHGARQLGFELASTDRIGIDFLNDLTRLCAHDPVKIIFDIGANEGQSARLFRQRFPTAQIHCFEPVAATHAKLAADTASDPRIAVHRFGFGERTGTATITLHASSGGNSIRNNAGGIGNEQIEIQRLDRFCESTSIATIDLMKIDVEGFEIDVLRGAGKMLADGNIRFIHAECVLDANQDFGHTTFAALQQFLKPQGFAAFCYYAESFGLTCASAMGNALFVHRSRMPAKVSGRVRNIY